MPPRSAALCATSQFLGVERCRAARVVVSQGLSRELAQRILRGRELVTPVLLVPELFAVDTLDCLGGSLPKAQQRLVEAWAEIHRSELQHDWELLQSGQPPVKIEPLR